MTNNLFFDRYIISDKDNIGIPVNSHLYKTLEHATAERDVYNDKCYGDTKTKPYGVFRVCCYILKSEIK